MGGPKEHYTMGRNSPYSSNLVLPIQTNLLQSLSLEMTFLFIPMFIVMVTFVFRHLRKIGVLRFQFELCVCLSYLCLHQPKKRSPHLMIKSTFQLAGPIQKTLAGNIMTINVDLFI